MSIKALNQNIPSLGFGPNVDEQGLSDPSFVPHGEGSHPYPSPWSFQSGNGQAGHPGHPYASVLGQFIDVDFFNEANNETGNASASHKRSPYPGPQGHHPTYHFPGYAQQPHAYRNPAEGRNRNSHSWDGDKFRPSFPPHAYQFPGGSHNASLIHQQSDRYPGNASGGTSFSRQPYSLPYGQQGGHGNRGWGGHSSFGQANFGGPSFGSHGRGGCEVPRASEGPCGSRPTRSQPPPCAFPSTGSEKYRPEVDVFDTPETFVIHVPLPGAKKEDIEVNWDPKTVELIIAGVIGRPGSEDLVKMIVLDERTLGAFERKVRLGSTANPPKIDGDAVSAKLEDGVLVVTVPKTEADDVDVKKVEVE
ncbi:Heat shock protein 42 [Penicillium digitatum]|uniref:Heat shock protein 42 n=3 Tax=Penicillium digitatum TaxID=36651 RepID=K9G9F5_PEND2|nr:Heat shock protein 42 [Penicillium digitatum Pd1]EKV11493.1 Heat shock protein 42 [Penicillium digitatum PHI26]EKV20171.1 Heat shock protein 42 [Penicillium digitatum Pd1]QQK39523.1 Heat shock protein 42 [Penicillium digitatum]